MSKKIKNDLKIRGIITATLKDAKTGEVLKVWKHKNTIQLAGRAALARRLANDTTYTGIINYGALFTGSPPSESFRKLASGYAYDDATATAYVSFFYDQNDCEGTFTQFSNYIDGGAGSGTGQEFSQVSVSWTKTLTTTLTVDCEYQLTSA